MENNERPMPSKADQVTMNHLHEGMKKIMDTILQQEINSSNMVLAILPEMDDADKMFWAQIAPGAQKRIVAGAVHDYVTILKRHVAAVPPPVPGEDY